MTPESGAGWFPRINRLGQIVCGNVEVFAGRPGAWASLGHGNTPFWVSDTEVVFNSENETVLVNADGSNRRVVKSGGSNEMSAALTGRWNIRRPPSYVAQYQGETLLTESHNVGLVHLSPNGQHSAFVDQPQANIKNLYVDNAGVTTTEITSVSVGDTGMCWTEATSMYTRRVMGFKYGETPADWSVTDKEGPQIVDVEGDPWVLSGTDTGIILRQAGTKVGYERLGIFQNPHIMFFPATNTFTIVSSDDAGRLQVMTISRGERMVPLGGVGRTMHFGFFEFAGHTDCPTNCRLPVVQNRPWLTVITHDGDPLYRYVAGDPDGDVDAIDRAVAAAKDVGDGLPVLAYVPRGASAVRLPDAVVGVECYRRVGESVADFERYIRQTVARCPRAVLIAQCYTSNATLSDDLRSIPPVIARVARDMHNVEGILVFSGSGRGTGFQDHPSVQPDWRTVAATITSPSGVQPPVQPPTTPNELTAIAAELRNLSHRLDLLIGDKS
jgi:hypothetical protein